MSPPAAVRRQLISYATASVALSLPWPLLLVLVWDRYGAGPHGPLIVGLTGAARMLPYVLLSWVVGSLGDRVCRERLLAVTLGLRVVCCAVVTVAVPAGLLVLAVVAAALAVAFGTPAYPTVAAAMPRLAGPASRRATELLVTVEVAAWVVGPAVGGLMLLPDARPFIPAAALGLTILATALARGVALPGPVTDRGAREAVTGMLRTVRRSPTVLVALASGGLVNLVAAATAVTLLPLVKEVWGQGDDAFGLATAWFGFGALGAPLLWWAHGSAQSRRTWGVVVLGVAVGWVALSKSPAAALPALALAGAVAVLVECAVTEILQTGVADEHRAGVLGLADAVMVSCAMVGSFVAPILAAGVGARVGLLLAGLVCLVGMLPGGRARRRDDHRVGVEVAPQGGVVIPR